jgi:hypothetical protein
MMKNIVHKNDNKALSTSETNIIVDSQSSKINILTAEANTKDETLKAFNQRLKQIEAMIKTNN